MNFLKAHKTALSTIFLVIIHLVGFIGLCSKYQQLFLTLTPINLIVTTLILGINHNDFSKQFLYFAIACFVFGFGIELLGVHSGIIFGNYYYRQTLGFQLMDVPIIIGLNWLILVYCVGTICEKINSNILLRSIVGALMLVALDYCIEPIAIRFDYWNWENSVVPFQNYIAWFAVGFALLVLYNKVKFKKDNKIVTAVFIIQLVFFIALNAS